MSDLLEMRRTLGKLVKVCDDLIQETGSYHKSITYKDDFLDKHGLAPWSIIHRIESLLEIIVRDYDFPYRCGECHRELNTDQKDIEKRYCTLGSGDEEVINKTNYKKAINEALEMAQGTGKRCFLYFDVCDEKFVVLPEYRKDYLFYVYSGGRASWSAQGEKLAKKFDIVKFD